jgi:hypothetical protein
LKKYIKYLSYSTGTILLIVVITILFSPYGRKDRESQKIIKESIIINATSEEVYNYLGNSDNAEDWSVYVDHITSINSETHKDGEIGSVRRCFKSKDETGTCWDEEILITEKNKRRRLSIFNMHEFGVATDILVTEQLYLQKGDKCEVFLTLFYLPGKANWYDELKLYFSAYKVTDLFKGNLKGIKAMIEN